MKDEMSERLTFDEYSFGAIQRRSAHAGVYAVIGKRVFDLLFATLALAAISPVIAVLWVLVRRDGGKGFFAHKRVGQNGREFMCWKLRTMVPNAEAALTELLRTDPQAAKEWAETMKLKNDPRITRIGAFLRKSRLDELPQFWNVLIGDMSVVGPRPVTRAEIVRYGADASIVLALRPGVTGPWQISGVAGESYAERVAIDAAYVRQMRFSLDISVILKTVLTVVRMTGH